MAGLQETMASASVQVRKGRKGAPAPHQGERGSEQRPGTRSDVRGKEEEGAIFGIGIWDRERTGRRAHGRAGKASVPASSRWLLAAWRVDPTGSQWVPWRVLRPIL